MTTAGSTTATSFTWRSMLPAFRAYRAVPSSRHPLIVAEQDRDVLGYVRDALLASPPRSRLPAWTFTAARQALAVRPLWRLAPRVRAAAEGNVWLDRPKLAEALTTRHRGLLLNHSRDADIRAVLLLFDRGELTPSLAVKLADETGAARLRAEHERLLWLAEIVPDSVRRTVPVVRAVEDAPGCALLATTAQPGTSMFVLMNRAHRTRRPAAVHADFSAATSWLSELQSVTTGPPAPLDIQPGVFAAAHRQLADLPVARLDVLRGLDALRSRLGRVMAGQTVVHGDYWPGNLLVRRGAISGVIDWERAEQVGSPVRDLARFAVAYSTYLDQNPTTRGAGITYGMKGTGWYPDLARGFLAEGLHRLGVPDACANDVMLAEVAAIAAEATDEAFAREHWRVFHHACRTESLR